MRFVFAFALGCALGACKESSVRPRADADAADALGDAPDGSADGMRLEDARADALQPARIPFGAFHFGIEDRPARAQIDLLDGLGYDGIMVQWSNADDFRAFAADARVRSNAFAIFAALAGFDINVTPEETTRRASGMAAELVATRTPLWVMLLGPKDGVKATATAIAIAEAAAPFGVEVVLYPHDDTAVEELRESTAILAAAQKANLRTSLHLCHEFKAGNQNSLAEIIAEGIPTIGLASINGSFSDAQTTPGWARGIVPLDEGDFDVENLYLKPLLAQGFRGPVLLHTYGIAAAPEDHLARSMARWRQMLLP